MSRKKSETEKKKQGTARADRVKAVKARIPKGWPAPDIDMNKTEQQAYAGLCRHLEEVGTLYEVDKHILTIAAVNIGQGVLAMQKLREMGPIQEFENGTRNVSPEYSIFEKCAAMHMRYSRLLGLDPDSRLRMDYFLNEAKEEEKDPIAEAMEKAKMRRIG